MQLTTAMAKLQKNLDSREILISMYQLENLTQMAAGYPGEGHVKWSSMTLYSQIHGLAKGAENQPSLVNLIENTGLIFKYARFMVLQSGGVIRKHSDSFLNTRTARLHLPLLTHDNVYLYIDDERCLWKPGEIWFGDFSRPHWAHNYSHIDRVHLVMDVEINETLIQLIENESVKQLLKIKLNNCISDSTEGYKLSRFCMRFDLPVGFSLPEIGYPPLTEATPAAVCKIGDELWITVNEQPLLQAIPVSDDTLDVKGLPFPLRAHYEFNDGSPSALSLVVQGNVIRFTKT